ncbi:hypothetical protein [Amycolatopsis coloradensis]|uniref:hypothetical protein n=1 Tax=Amycolatopsis coloradensis TaxID=76021 RepID=UPI001FCA12DC|nr:hypothetical protein [Amycolatopsis coloradensis]
MGHRLCRAEVDTDGVTRARCPIAPVEGLGIAVDHPADDLDDRMRDGHLTWSRRHLLGCRPHLRQRRGPSKAGRPHARHIYGYRLEPAEGGTLVTSYYHWSEVGEEWKERVTFPVVPESALKATLGILERTVRRRG